MSTSRRIILTRQKEQNEGWARALAAAGIPVLTLPLIRYENLPLPVGWDPEDFAWILFTSPHAVQAFCGAGLKPGQARVGALGTGTGTAVQACGFPIDFAPGLKDGVAFAKAFAAHAQPPAAVLLPGPEQRLPEPVAILEQAGFLVRQLPLYRTVAVAAADLPAAPFEPRDVVFFCSPSTVQAFCAVWDERLACVAIGETTATAARACGFAPQVAAEPDLQAMVRAAGLDLDLKP